MRREDSIRLAQEIDEHLRVIRQVIRQPAEAEFARGGLTGPQRSVMHALALSAGLSLKKLSETVGLAHSTTSGIVDRLEKQGLVERQPDEADRRTRVIAVSKKVRAYLHDTRPQLLIHPLAEALSEAKPNEREQIASGLTTLRRLLERGRAAGQVKRAARS